MQNELRKDYVLDKWVIYTPIESNGKSDGKDKKTKKKKKCVFCSKLEDWNKNEEVKVVSDEIPTTHPSKFDLQGVGTLFTKSLAHGHSEIVVETKEHKPFHELSTNQIKKCLDVYIKRIKEMKTWEKVECVFIEKNYSLHSHTKVYTLPKVPEKLRDEIVSFNNYKKKKDACIFCDILKEEKAGRVIHKGKHFVVIAPFASFRPYEAWILTKEHTKNFLDLGEEQLYELSEILSNLTKNLASLGKDYNFVVHEKPVARDMQDFHFHIEVFPSIISRNQDVYTNSITPERAVRDLRFE